MDDGGMPSYDGIWSVITKQHMTQAKTQYQSQCLSMDDGGMPSYDGTWLSNDGIWLVSHHKTTYNPSQDPIPKSVIEYG